MQTRLLSTVRMENSRRVTRKFLKRKFKERERELHSDSTLLYFFPPRCKCQRETRFLLKRERNIPPCRTPCTVTMVKNDISTLRSRDRKEIRELLGRLGRHVLSFGMGLDA